MLRSSVWRTYTTGLNRADVAAVLLSTAGAIHLGAAPQHWGHSPAHGLFLFTVGLAELLWAAAYWRRSSPSLTTLGAVLAGGSIVLWGITRVLPAPFGHGPEALGVLLVAIDGHERDATRVGRAVSPRTQQRGLPTSRRSRDDRHPLGHSAIQHLEEVIPLEQAAGDRNVS